MAINLIKDDGNFASLLTFLRSSERISFDTEFIRDKTFFPKIGLLQLEAQGEIFLVDPLELKDFYKVFDVICEGDFVTICHGAPEDLEIISNIRRYGFDCSISENPTIAKDSSYKGNLLPKYLYDTQIAAKFLNADSNVGLASLLAEKIGIKLEKTETRTDWLARPFTEAQIEYAALDVAYLEKLTEIFAHEFMQKPRSYEYFKDEMHRIALSYENEVDQSLAYIYLRNTGNLKQGQLKMLKALCALRHEICFSKDIAPSRFMKNETMINLVKSSPFDLSAYHDLGVHYNILKKYGKLIKETLQDAYSKRESVLPTLEAVFYDDRLKPLVAKLKSYLKEQHKKLEINKDFLTANKLIQSFFYYHYYDTCIGEPVLESGWRREAIGDISRFLSRDILV